MSQAFEVDAEQLAQAGLQLGEVVGALRSSGDLVGRMPHPDTYSAISAATTERAFEYVAKAYATVAEQVESARRGLGANAAQYTSTEIRNKDSFAIPPAPARSRIAAMFEGQ
ncbi:hypothetical protein [Embleya sp. NPDC005575]|jgi:hypothetical protein|uniref:hypothetical protein n=1 Tax=Embleya sp. NPDC005575 TaxID=3156892 RepID=UPI0033AABA63